MSARERERERERRTLERGERRQREGEREKPIDTERSHTDREEQKGAEENIDFVQFWSFRVAEPQKNSTGQPKSDNEL